MLRRLATLLGGTSFLAVSLLASTDIAAATLTVAGCSSFSTTSDGSGNLMITCNAGSPTPGGPTCSSLGVSPPNNSTNPASITLTANCSAGSSAITTYTFTGPNVNATQSNASLQIIPAPASSATYSVKASDGTLTSNAVSGVYTVGGKVDPGDVDLSACTAQGLSGQLIDIAYPQGSNVRNTTTSFSASTALVYRFTTPNATTGTPSIAVAQGGVPLVAANRVVAIATQPCQFPTSSAASGSIMRGTRGTNPTLYLSLAPVTAPTGLFSVPPVQLLPNTTYFVTVVNRNGYFGSSAWTNSCMSGVCNINFNFQN